MKIGIIGAGNIGGNLGRRWSSKGHSIRFGARDADKLAQLVADCGANASAGDVASAAAFGDVVVLAVPFSAVPDAVRAAGDLKGKILVDATNPVKWTDGPEPAVEGTSAAQKLAESCPGARVVKAFNTLGAEHILNPVVGGQTADVFVCGDDAAARKTVSELAEEIGFSAVDTGPLKNARLTEHLALAWIWLAMKGGLGRNVAFKLLR